MKPLFTTILLFFLALIPMSAMGEKEVSYLSEISFLDREVVRQNRQISLSMTVDLSRLRINRQHSIALIPVLVSADGTREAEFPQVVVDGSVRSKVYMRANKIEGMPLPPHHNANANVIIRRKNGDSEAYYYRSTMAYERWMLNGRIEIREFVSGCTNCLKGQSVLSMPEADEALLPFLPQFKTQMLSPQPEPVKHRAEVKVARLQFKQNSHTIIPEFKNNKSELDIVRQSIDVVNTDPALTITGIFITGYASPEGSEEYNKRLSEKRADALAEYVRGITKTDKQLWHVQGVGEDWLGLRREVAKHTDLLKQDEVLRIIDSCEGDKDECERQLKALVPPDIYFRLLNEMYGVLRRNEYRIEYTVRNFNIDETKRQITTHPELLSLDEMYRVARTYDAASAEYCNVINTAARIYPNNKVAVVNAALLDIAYDNAEKAINRLETFADNDDADIANTLGVAYSNTGKLNEALVEFRKAKALNHSCAAHNIMQLESMMADL